MANSDATEKKVFIKRDANCGWVYLCPHCLKRIVIRHNMKKCDFCDKPININKASIYKGK